MFMVSSAPRSRHARVASLLACLVVLVGLLPSAVAAAPPAGSPTLLSPTEGATVSSNPTFSWTAVGGAVKYRVQVSTSPAFSTLTYNVDTVNLKATPPADLPLGLLYWRVAATDGAAGVGSFASGTFTKEWGAAPTITSPDLVDSFDFPTQPVLFRWQPLAGAKSYTLEIDDASDFIGATSYTTNNTNFTLTEPPTTNQTFFWRLRATSSTGGVVSDWTETREYTYTWSTVPTLLTPANNLITEVQDIVFSWQPVVGAKTYELQVSPNGDWANNLALDVVVKGTKYSPPATLDNDGYFWRVRAKDAANVANNGGWSAEWQFNRAWSDLPTLLTPAWVEGDPPALTDVPTFTWTPVHHASYYEIQFSEDINFSPGDPTTVSCFTNHTSWTPYKVITGGGEPAGCQPGPVLDVLIPTYWHVRAIDAPTGVLGQWSNSATSDTWRFVRDPSGVTLLTPTAGQNVTTPVLSWTPKAGAVQYRVTILKSNKTTAVGGTPFTTYATSFTPTAVLNPADGPFYWYVQAIDVFGVASAAPANPTRSFTVSAPTTDTSLDLLTPADGSSSVRMPSMTWQPYTGADYYQVGYGIVGGGVNPTPLSGNGTKLPYAGFTYAALTLSPNTYFWFVKAYDSSDVLLDTSVSFEFTINDAGTLGSLNYIAPDRCLPADPCPPEADTPTLTWNSVPNAGAYEVTVANDSAFTNQIRKYLTSNTSLTPRESYVDSQSSQGFFWFVRPCVDANRVRCGPDPTNNLANDNASAFKKISAAVEPTAPADSATVANQVTFTWSDYLDTNASLGSPVDQEAKSYKFEASLVADFSTIFDTVTVDQTTYTPFGKTYPEGPLYWRVQAIDGSNNTLTKSPPRLVTKSSPKLTTTFPSNGSTQSGVPFFQWTPQAYAATYLVEVYKNGDTLFSPANKVLSATTKFSAWAPTTSLPTGDYAWRVRRNDADNRAGPWSNARTFTLLAAAPSLVTPSNAAVVAGNTLLFTWTGVPGAVQYRFEVAATCAFSPVTSSQVTVMTAWAPITTYADGSYCWHVKALDAAGNTISTSSNRTFTVGSAPPPPPSATTFAPVDPVRMLDTRSGHSIGLSGKFTANTARLLTVAGRLGIPNDAVAITGNVTVVGQTNAGYISVTPTLNNNPSTSALNFPTGDTRANNITSPLSGGKLSLVYRSLTGAKADILLDVTGYFLENNSGATYKTVTPVRLLDSRVANGITGAVPTHTVKRFNIAGRGGVPANATAVTGNFTVVGQQAAGYATLGPAVTDNPTTSTINFPMGDTRANGITVRLAGDGSLSLVWIAASGKTSQFLFDVTGYYLANLTGSKFYPLSPGRVLDTRNGTGLSGTFKTDVARTLTVRGHVGVPAPAIAVTGNLTVVGQTKSGYVSMTQSATNSPTTSTLNFPVADVRANGVTGPLSGGGSVGLVYKGSATGSSTNLILDITGYFAP
jgi:hypothetical protein